MSEHDVVQKGVHNYSQEDSYVKPQDPLLLERLEWFQDQKLGLMMHWGPYSQLGLVESWALSDADADWSRVGYDWEPDAEEFKRQYFDLNKTFNPLRFQPEVWADLAAKSGFKYLIFTTKHHDGFCMWDTNTTQYKITGSDCPFHRHKYADICREVFDAFRDRGIAIAAYFSKADWHTPYYWAPGMERSSPTWRGPSYKPSEYPWLWDKFVEFTHEQIMELMTRYGRIDILWLDAGWVCPQAGQDIRLGEVIEKARKVQPWLLAVDRTVGGPHENYVTPEQTIPVEPLHIPWESCVTMGTSFSFGYEDEYKSLRQLVKLLVEIVAKGGNLALNVGPQPDGRLPKGAVRCMTELGEWLKIYGESIYGTRPVAPYFKDNWAFAKKDEVVYATYVYSTKDSPRSQWYTIPYHNRLTKVELLGGTSKLTTTSLHFEQTDQGLRVQLPQEELQGEAPVAHVLKLT